MNTSVEKPTSTRQIGCYEIVVIGGSAGGIVSLLMLLGQLPHSFPLPILVAQHLSPSSPSVLAEILSRQTSLVTKWAQRGERPQGGTVYLSPANRQLLMAPDGSLALVSLSGKRGVGTPAADPLFESAAKVHGSRVISIVLSGLMWDGARGTRAVKAAGGLCMAQSARSCSQPEMPISAIDLGRAEIVFSPARLAMAMQHAVQLAA